MSTDESGSEVATREEPKDTKKGKGASESAREKDGSTSVAAPLDEEKINAPSRQDLVMLGVICVSTLILWAAGRAACNYQVPGESLTPRRVSLEERTRTPKDVGIEFAQAIGGGDFETAAKLSRGEAAAFVKTDEASCGVCTQRKNVAEKLLSVGTVLKSNSIDSIVSVRTIGGGSETVRVLGIEREGRKWFVTRRYDSAADAKLKEDPSSDQAPAGLRRPDEEPKVADEGASQDDVPTQKPRPQGSSALNQAVQPSKPESSTPPPQD